jgi:hypothetical protein
MLERGKLDLIFHIDEGLLPSHISSEKLYREDWICAVARQSKFGDRLTLKQYLASCLPGAELVLTLVNWHETNGGEEFHLATRESTARVTSISFLDGLAPEAHYRRTPHVASRGGAPSFSSGSIWATSFARSQLNHSGKPNAAVHEGSMRRL